MTDTTLANISSAKQGSGKFWAVLVATKVTALITYFAKARFNYDVDAAMAVEISGDIMAFITWLTPQTIIGTIKGFISDWKDIVKAWRYDGKENV